MSAAGLPETRALDARCCVACAHWAPRETPAWAAREGMAVCILKRTKAVTMSSWAKCDRFMPAPDAKFQERLAYLRARGVRRVLSAAE